MDSTTITILSKQICHGCNGKGWVETSDRKPHECPVCAGSGQYDPNTIRINPTPNPYPYVPYVPYYPPVIEPWRPKNPWDYPWTITCGDSNER